MLFVSAVALIVTITLQHGWPNVGFEGMMFWAPVMFWASAGLGAAALALSLAEVHAEPRRPRALVLMAGSTLILLAWCVVLTQA